MFTDFGTLPPEINSARIYSGPGSALLRAAASSWHTLSNELYCAATSYHAVIASLTEVAWRGPSAWTMTAAVGRYVAWLAATAAHAKETAVKANLAADAFDAAFSATVPPPLIAANRTLLAALIATNFLGQNATAIAATEARYAQMWAQDATAMCTYADAARAATNLSPFPSAPQTGRLHGGHHSPGSAAELATNNLHAVLQTGYNVLKTVDGPYGLLGASGVVRRAWQLAISIESLINAAQSLSSHLSPKIISGALAPLMSSRFLTGAVASPVAVPAATAVTAATGHAGVIGPLSVPTSWAASLPAVRSIATALPSVVLEGLQTPEVVAPAAMAGGQNGMFGQMALSSLAGRAASSQTRQAFDAAGTRTIGAVTRVTGGTDNATTTATGAAATAGAPATTATIIVIPPAGK